MPYKEKKMKKKWITAVLCLSVLTTMTGTFVKADDTVQEESILEKYEHQHREVGEAVYRKAASAFSGEMEVRVHLTRSVQRRNCSILQIFWRRMRSVTIGENIIS